MKRVLRALWCDEHGQGMTEYMLLVVLLAVTLGLAFRQFQHAVVEYYDRVTFWISLPIP
ncbi:hypothetical protein JW905_14825 [bacterium]|nr:hypothetical protein [candidate division CSSED10-310 bacterium]